MKISVIDASNYFKGLLLLIRKDRKITESESNLMKRVGKALGFDRDFCETAIAEILDNAYIVDESPSFSSKEIAMRFVKDGLALAFSDDELHPREEHWLRSAAEKNGIDAAVVSQELEDVKNRAGGRITLEVEKFTVKHS